MDILFYKTRLYCCHTSCTGTPETRFLIYLNRALGSECEESRQIQIPAWCKNTRWCRDGGHTDWKLVLRRVDAGTKERQAVRAALRFAATFFTDSHLSAPLTHGVDLSPLAAQALSNSILFYCFTEFLSTVRRESNLQMRGRMCVFFLISCKDTTVLTH